MAAKVDSEIMSHLGLVSAMCDEIGLVELIDSMIPNDSRKKVSTGECAKIMVISGLGYRGRALYTLGEFFENKPIEFLLRKGINIADINDDVLGRTLDRLYNVGPELIFSRIASRAAKHFDINSKTVHLDTTSMKMFGKYEEKEGQRQVVKYGYSKDKRPDLKQVMVSLLVSNEGNFPLMGASFRGKYLRF